MVNRREFLKYTGAAGVGLVFTGGYARLMATPAYVGLSDPYLQPKFVSMAPNPLAPGFLYQPDRQGRYKVQVQPGVTETGLVDSLTQAPLSTSIWGFAEVARGRPSATWPGKTFQVKNAASGGAPETEVVWANALDGVTGHLLPVDTSLHWCYALPGYAQHSIASAGVPIAIHLHGGHSDFPFDGNPEFFYSPEVLGQQVVGPQWASVPGGFSTKFRYDNDVPAGNLWYHDHALGITRLNVYAGLAGFYFVRDQFDTGDTSNPLGLPSYPYEIGLAIQDRMFTNTGALFYPAFPGQPFYDDFITGEGAILPPDLFPGGGPSALAEFFGDHMVVNGKIWPKMDVEARNYRLRLLNGCDSRFLAIQFWEVPAGATDFSAPVAPVPFAVIGSDQGLASSPTTGLDTLLIETGGRYDVIIDFKNVTPGNRVIMKNVGGDEPFGGDIPGPQVFGETDRIMAFDVVHPYDGGRPDVSPLSSDFSGFAPAQPAPTRFRKVALFEGLDEFGRLQPLLGTAEPASDYLGNPVHWPATPEYQGAGLVGPMEGAIGWHSPTTENPAVNSTEEWEIWNMTMDGHPIHLHLVHFEIVGRQEIVWDSATTEEDRVLDPAGNSAPAPNGDGTYLVAQPVVQHHGLLGQGFRIVNHTLGAAVPTPAGYVENAPKDMVTALPGQVTRIRATFDKPGRYVWHCHILSHEDHEMMRVLHVGPGANAAPMMAMGG